MPSRLSYEVPQVQGGPQDIANQAWNDPWFALGNLLARNWNRNYDRRGVNKLMDSMEGSIPDEAVTLADAKAAETPEETARNTILGNYAASEIAKPANEVEGLQNLLGAVNAAADGNLDYQQMKQLVNGEQPTANRLPKYESELAQSIGNYVANATGREPAVGLSNAAAESLSSPIVRAPQEFNYDDWEAKVWEEGRRQGRPDYQIQEAIAKMAPKAERAAANYNEYMAGQLENRIGDSMNAAYYSGDYRPVFSDLNQLRKYDPKLAALYYANTTPFDEMQRHIWREGDIERANLFAQMNAQNGAAGQGGNKQGAAGKGASASASGAGGGGGSGRQNTPDANQRLIYNITDTAQKALASLDRQELGQALQMVGQIYDNIQNDAEEAGKYSDTSRRTLGQLLYTLNSVTSYLDGNYDNAETYARAVRNAGSPWTQYLMNNRVDTKEKAKENT